VEITVFNILQLDISLLVTSIVLMIMGSAALFLALLLRVKARALGMLPKDLSARVFDKTFNVFDPGMKHRQIITSHTGLIIFIAIYGSWLAFVYIVFKTFEAGGVLGSIAFLICAALLMVDETQEISKNAGIFAKAVKSGVGLGKGDMQVLYVIKKTLPRLTAYHLILAVVFYISALAVPFFVDAVFLASTGIAALVFAVGVALKTIPLFSLVVIAVLMGSILVVAEIVANKTKRRVFGFPPPVSIDILSRQFFRMKMYVGIQHHHPTLREPSPEDTEKANRKDIEEHREK
jgi:hypothetical protein